MTQKEVFRAIVGMMILTSLALGVLVNPWALLFTAFIGVNMFQSAFSSFCPMDIFLRKAGLAECREAKSELKTR
jgi:hypothetical protein